MDMGAPKFKRVQKDCKMGKKDRDKLTRQKKREKRERQIDRH
jgi:hypothetical protein